MSAKPPSIVTMSAKPSKKERTSELIQTLKLMLSSGQDKRKMDTLSVLKCLVDWVQQTKDTCTPKCNVRFEAPLPSSSSCYSDVRTRLDEMMLSSDESDDVMFDEEKISTLYGQISCLHNIKWYLQSLPENFSPELSHDTCSMEVDNEDDANILSKT